MTSPEAGFSVMQKLSFLFALLFAFAIAAPAQESVKFHGLYVGQPAADFVDCATRHKVEGWKETLRDAVKQICSGKMGGLEKGQNLGKRDVVLIENGKVKIIMIQIIDLSGFNLPAFIADIQAKVPGVQMLSAPFQSNDEGAGIFSYNEAMWQTDELLMYVKKLVDINARSSMPVGAQVIISDNKAAQKEIENRPNSLD